MSLHPQPIGPIPDETARVARAAFPKGNLYLTLRDDLGTLFTDHDFSSLFPTHGQPAASPWRLALICVFQFIEGVSDRQAADAVRSRIDWKYALGLDLTNPGFDFSVLCEFRARLIAGSAEQAMLDTLLTQFKARGWLKARGKQRTDSTHVLAAIRTLNRLEGVGETLRAALNALAVVAPDWLQQWVPADWFERYGRPVEEYHLPKGVAARQQYAEQIDADGATLLAALDDPTVPAWLREVPAIVILRHTWGHQFILAGETLRWRTAAELPPAGERHDSPYDPDARYGNKRSTTWTGYKVHVTETCDRDAPHLITRVATTPAHHADIDQTLLVHADAAQHNLVPAAHLVDAGYVDGSVLVASQRDHGIQVVGPMRPNVSWQAHVSDAFDISHFVVDWQARTVTCPEGHRTKKWSPAQDGWGNTVINVKFSRTACRMCPSRTRCTRAKADPRELTLRSEAEHEAIQALRRHQQTPAWKVHYNGRAGIEGTLSQGIRAFGLRAARYRGLAKTHLQHGLTAVAINLVRIVAWLGGVRHAVTRTSRFAALAPPSMLC